MLTIIKFALMSALSYSAETGNKILYSKTLKNVSSRNVVYSVQIHGFVRQMST